MIQGVTGVEGPNLTGLRRCGKRRKGGLTSSRSPVTWPEVPLDRWSGLQFEYVSHRAELICPSCLAPIAAPSTLMVPPRRASRLLEVMEAIRDAEQGRGTATLAELGRAVEFLWSTPPNSRRPTIALLAAELPFGRVPIPKNAETPITNLSLAWRSATLLAIGQILELPTARADFPAESRWLKSSCSSAGQKLATRVHPIVRTPPPEAVCCDLLIGFKSMAYVMHYSDFPH